MKKSTLLFALALTSPLWAQVGINTKTPDPSAALEVKASDKGFLPPSVTLKGAKDNSTISKPATGLVVYHQGNDELKAGLYTNTGTPDAPSWTSASNALIAFNANTKCLQYHNGAKWIDLCGDDMPDSERTINILSLIPDEYNEALAPGTYGESLKVARLKLDNKNNFGPSGKVTVGGIDYSEIDLTKKTGQDLAKAINKADIIWIGSVLANHFSQEHINILKQKIQENKKFFVISVESNYIPINKLELGYTVKFEERWKIAPFYTMSSAAPNDGAFGLS